MNIRDIIYRYLVDHYPRIVIDHRWKKEYGYRIDWNNPRDLNEKIQWLICYGDTSQWPMLADKYRVREYVKSKGLGHLLPEIYGVWEDANNINFDALPDRFVLKCNHDSGSFSVIDKNSLDKNKVVNEYNRFLSKRFGYKYCEPHYNRIKPYVIAEEFLQSKDSFSTSLIDYKIWCFDGKAYYIWACYNRDKSKTYVNVFDLDWTVHPEYSVFTNYYRDGEGKVERPEQLEEMIDAAETLAKGLPQVRVDFYDIDGRVVFSEITLTSSRGRMDFYTKQFLEELGKKVILPNK